MTQAAMGVPWMLDMLVGAILLAAAYLKGRRGLYNSLMPLVVSVASLLCAVFVSAALTGPVTDLVYPMVEDWVVPAIRLDKLSTEDLENAMTIMTDTDAMVSKLEELLPKDMRPMLSRLGMDLKTFLSELMGKIRESGTINSYLSEAQLEKLAGIGVNLKAATGDVRSAARSALDMESILFTAIFSLARRVTSLVVHFFLWLVSLIFFRIVFTVLKNVFGMTFRLPVIGWANALGGAALGALECAVILFIIGWLASFLGFTALHDMGGGTKLYQLFF